MPWGVAVSPSGPLWALSGPIWLWVGWDVYIGRGVRQGKGEGLDGEA